jgi:hypothetical protein
MEEAVQAMERVLSIKLPLSMNQFFLSGFVEAKLNLCIDLINNLKAKHASLVKRSSSVKENLDSLPITEDSKQG